MVSKWYQKKKIMDDSFNETFQFQNQPYNRENHHTNSCVFPEILGKFEKIVTVGSIFLSNIGY